MTPSWRDHYLIVEKVRYPSIYRVVTVVTLKIQALEQHFSLWITFFLAGSVVTKVVTGFCRFLLLPLLLPLTTRKTPFFALLNAWFSMCFCFVTTVTTLLEQGGVQVFRNIAYVMNPP